MKTKITILDLYTNPTDKKTFSIISKANSTVQCWDVPAGEYYSE